MDTIEIPWRLLCWLGELRSCESLLRRLATFGATVVVVVNVVVFLGVGVVFLSFTCELEYF
jgi:hypothetical protein